MMIRTTAITAALLLTTAVRAEDPVYVYSPCVTAPGSEPALNITAFDEEMKVKGFKQVMCNGKAEWEVAYRITRTMIYRFVGEYGEATCVVEVTSSPANTQLPSAPLNPVQAP